MSYAVRVLDETDLDALVALFGAYRTFYQRAYIESECRAFLQARLEKRELISFGVFDGGDLVAFGNVYPTFTSLAMREKWIINDVFVAASHRRKDIATHLMNFIMGEAERRRVKFLKLETEGDNVAAQKCYEKFGWDRTSRVTYHMTIEGV